MEATWGHLCASSEVQGPLATVRGLWSSINAEASGPITLRPFEIVLRLLASTSEGPGGHTLQVVLTDHKDQPCGAVITYDIPEFFTLGAGYPFLGGARLLVNNYVVPGPGAYSFDCAVNGVQLYRLPLNVYSPGRPNIVPKGIKPGGIRLGWMHLVRKLVPNPSGARTPDMIDIMDFLVLPPSMESANLEGAAVLLQLEGVEVKRKNGNLRVALVNGDGQEVLPPFQRRIDLENATPKVAGAIITVGLNAIELKLDEGYQVKTYLDDQPFGRPLDLRVLRVGRAGN